MAAAEAARKDRIDAVAIVTPNHLHYAPAKAFLEAGIHVICDKPLTTTLEDAQDLERTVRRTGLLFAVTHNYTGYPMVRQAREMIAGGELGRFALSRLNMRRTGWPLRWSRPDRNKPPGARIPPRAVPPVRWETSELTLTISPAL